MISSQSDETGILDVLEIEFFEKKKTFKKTLKKSFCGFTLCLW